MVSEFVRSAVDVKSDEDIMLTSAIIMLQRLTGAPSRKLTEGKPPTKHAAHSAVGVRLHFRLF